VNVLAINIGNTNAHDALFCGGAIERVQIFPVDACNDEIFIVQRMREYQNLDAVVLAGGHPPAQRALKNTLQRIFEDKLYVGREDFDFPIKCNCRHPEKVGDDRLLNALAAYDACKKPCIVIDLGSALTIDYVSARGEFEGGVIFPGVWASARALNRETQKLPEIKALNPGPVIGRDTEEAIQSGLFWGYRALITGMVNEFKISIHGRPRIFATGGDTPYVMKDMDFRFEIVPHLTLMGLRLALKIQKGI